MKRRTFLIKSLLAAGALLSPVPPAIAGTSGKNRVRVQLLRHATLLVEMGDVRILVDPMLSKKEMMDPVANATNCSRIPMVDLPLSEKALDDLLKQVNAVLLTHTHRDHWDMAAQQKIDKNTLVWCQPADEKKIRDMGFNQVKKIEAHLDFKDIRIHRTGGQHGTGELASKMGPVSGYILEYKDVRIYIAGDTIWCRDVQDTILKFQPTHLVVNGGGARFLEGGPITMTIEDVLEVTKHTSSPVYVVHLETVNHCLQRRPDFRSAVKKESLERQVFIPEDGKRLISHVC